jgi:hypothetical protein
MAICKRGSIAVRLRSIVSPSNVLGMLRKSVGLTTR